MRLNASLDIGVLAILWHNAAMAWFLFIDESGQDHQRSPYEVLAGVAIKDESLWEMVKQLHDAEVANFGRRYSGGARELKGKKILKTKTFRLTELNCDVLPHEIPRLAKEALDDGAANNSVRHLKALALAKIAYVKDVFSICSSFGCRIFASVVEIDAPPTALNGLRKDYGYLFERFFYFLADQSSNTGSMQHGVLVFDELEKSRSHILIDQAHRYFKETAIGRQRASLIIPEPFFVHSDLTTGVQIAVLGGLLHLVGLPYARNGSTCAPRIGPLRSADSRPTIPGDPRYVPQPILRDMERRPHH